MPGPKRASRGGPPGPGAGRFRRTTPSSVARREATLALVEAFTAAGVPLEKLDSPRLRQYLRRHVPNAGSFPCANKLRQDYLPALPRAAPAPSARQLLARHRRVSVAASEATDACGRYVLHVLLVPGAWDPRAAPVFQAEPAPLASLNFSTVAQAVVTAVVGCGVDFDQVTAFLSHDATYMSRAFSDVLRGVMPHAVHVACNARIVALAGEAWRACFPAVDSLVGAFKKALKGCPGRALRYCEAFAQQSGEPCAAVALPPESNQWSVWFDAVCYHAKHIKCYAQFVSEELEMAPGTWGVLRLQELLRQGDLEEQVRFVAKNVVRFVEVLAWFESPQATIHHVHNKLMDLISWVEDMASQQLADGPQENQRRQELFQAIAATLNQYYKYDPALPPRFRQPAASFFSAVRIFDPNQAPFLSFDPQLLKSIPGWGKEHDQERTAYMSFLKDCQRPLTVSVFWESVSNQFPHLYDLARCCLTIPANSVDAECAIPAYG